MVGEGTLLSDAYFAGDVFAPAGSGELFNRYTCIPCGRHSKTWEAFKAHRRACGGYQRDAAAVQPRHQDKPTEQAA